MDKSLVRVSRFISFILRHKPESIGLSLDEAGWANVSELLTKIEAQGRSLSMETLLEVVATDGKGRYAFNADETRIRANQGHSINIDLGLPSIEPPEVLFHGTATRFLDSIREQGLQRGQRQHVHLSPDTETAGKVGSRHGKPVILTILASQMHGEGHQFFVSENMVWLTSHVPVAYISFP